MFISIATSTGASVDINTARIDWILDKDRHFNVHIGGDTISVSRETYWDVLVPILFPEGEK
ncbi:hypothetical protein NVP1238A_89 [Vibrio phage 1.238.A._10N.261.52.F10]|uniref:Uncharacterized protein n=1 Tax=Vibrio phage 1.238.A._10N.261.52.F10 TaxID=1881231 RepID=A0A2I7RUK6_9CAUD|nr:hypothetical protein KNT79_gp89 [Vibrio phage 1.238.A._10N.261.52.F10]AUR97338.1 hypothetical protein NVP1238A_89 [Vibrio phage 1.238.A._10N.261.52.F10]AUR97432.1 hypothetical protein NVP1238B_90 [Vibrio phage 1.238.B._10N.261.52.F10]